MTNESLHLINERIQKKLERLMEKKKRAGSGDPRPKEGSNYCKKDKIEGETDGSRPGRTVNPNSNEKEKN